MTKPLLRFAPLLLVLTAFTAAADDLVTSVTPNRGPTAGGTEVVIKGNFLEGWHSGVFFGSTPAKSMRFVDGNTLIAVTPDHLPGNVKIAIFEYDLIVGTDVEFEFEGEVPDTFERILLPLLTPPVTGAHGSEFHTDLRARQLSTDNSVWLYGLAQPCELVPCEPNYAERPFRLVFPPPGGFGPQHFLYDGTPGRFVYVRKTELGSFALNLRVHDVSRAASNFGTEIPIARSRDFAEHPLILQGIPTDPRFRSTLRVYAATPGEVTLKIDGREPITLHLQAGETIFDPAYAVFSDFPVGNIPITAIVDSQLPLPVVPGGYLPIWAFVSVTNNDTQLITTITPQP